MLYDSCTPNDDGEKLVMNFLGESTLQIQLVRMKKCIIAWCHQAGDKVHIYILNELSVLPL